MTSMRSEDTFDRLIAAAALLRGFVSEGELAALLRDQPIGIARRLIERGRISPAEIDEFRQLIEQKQPSESGDDSPADRLLRRAQEKTIDPAIRSYLAGAVAPVNARSALVRYELLEVFGQGGVGRVWRARDLELHRDVALKEMRAEASASPVMVHKFTAEAMLTSRLQHPNIVTVLHHGGGGTENEFYVMPLLRGRTLDELIKDHHASRSNGGSDRLGLRRLLDVLINVCNAIAFAHASSIAHRDLKPANIMVGEFGEVFILDWGFAKDYRAGAQGDDDSSEMSSSDSYVETHAGTVMGSPLYMAPEQAAGKTELIGPASDIHALGAILFDILVGATQRRPRAGETMESFFARIAMEKPRTPRQAVPAVPRALDAICQKATEFRPNDRYPTAKPMAEDLRRWMADESVSVLPDGVFQQFARWTRRHGALTKAIFAVLLVASCLATYITQTAGRHLENRRILLGAKAEQMAKHLDHDLADWAEETALIRDRLAADPLFTGRPGQPAANEPGASEPDNSPAGRMLASFVALQHDVKAIVVYSPSGGVVSGIRDGHRFSAIDGAPFQSPGIDELRRAASERENVRFGKLLLQEGTGPSLLLLPIGVRLPDGPSGSSVLVLFVDFGSYFARVGEYTKELHYVIDCVGPDDGRLLRVANNKVEVLPKPEDAPPIPPAAATRTNASKTTTVTWLKNEGLWAGRRVEMPNGQSISLFASISYATAIGDDRRSDEWMLAVGSGVVAIAVVMLGAVWLASRGSI